MKIGQKINFLTLVYLTNDTRWNDKFGIFQCDCNRFCRYLIKDVQKWRFKHCGCIMENRRKNISGKKFGNLIAIRCISRKNGHTKWLCKCSCGNFVEKYHDKLKDKYSLEHNLLQCTKCRPFYRVNKKLESITGSYWGRVKIGAKSRNIPIKITQDDAYNQLVEQKFKCALTGLDIAINYKSVGETTASLDRINSKKGYTKNNIQWVHKDINKMKMNFNESYFIKLCKLIVNKN